MSDHLFYGAVLFVAMLLSYGWGFIHGYSTADRRP